MDKNLAINSGDLRLCKTADGKSVIVLVLFAEINSAPRMLTGWWCVLGDTGDGFKQYLMPSHRLHNLVHQK
jgi:hypothetical protein